ncbi:MAG TPA: gluconate:H+ symporter, partial [Chitinophagaceae bacterium]|nr:gluconate:H+ symporter [Chitinophagaceae bacterium]
MTFLVIILAIALQILLTAKKVSPFLSLLIVAIVAGLCLGMQPGDILKSIEKGVGSTLAGLALILCLGAILGKILEVGGAAEKISSTLINSFGEKNIQWAVMLTGFLVGIPLYYNAGFVILVPLVFSIARRTRLPLLYIAIPMAASLSVTHCFLPPHPGPVVLVNAFKADMGKTLLYGLILALPVAILAGIVLGKMFHRVKVNVNGLFAVRDEATGKQTPAALPSFLIALLPVLLITLAVVANNFLPDGNLLKKVLLFTGDSTIALLIAVLLASWQFGLRAGHSMETVMKWLGDGVTGIAMILLIIT